jgi:hypothetical protein
MRAAQDIHHVQHKAYISMMLQRHVNAFCRTTTMLRCTIIKHSCRDMRTAFVMGKVAYCRRHVCRAAA